jgi:photosystem II stability/assembly factor-like uncharacterized protein
VIRRMIALAFASAAMTPGLTPGTAGAATGVGHSGWYWGSPLPQGNDLAAVDFSGADGYAVGAFGTALRSADGGATWSGLPSGLTSDLTAVDAISASAVAIGGGCALRRSDDGGQTFRRLPWTASDSRCSSQIRAIRFPSPAVGYLLLEDGTLLRTADSGRTWARRATPGGTNGAGLVRDVQFTGDQAGVAIALGGGGITRTTDGGATWQAATVPVGSGLVALDLPTATTGYAVGPALAPGPLLKTVDGGETWTTVPGTPGGGYDSVRCFDADTCLLGSLLSVTHMTGGGAAFSAANVFSPPAARLPVIAPAGGARAVALTGDRVAASSDGGATWPAVGGSLPGFYRAVSPTSVLQAQAFGPSGALARTVDGGQTWTPAGVPSTADIVSVSFPDAANGFVLNAAGDLFATDNGAASWRSLDAGADDVRAVLALDRRRVLLVGPTGVKRSGDGGGVFDPVEASQVARATLTAADRAGSAAVVYGPRTVAASPDGGRRWTAIKLPTRSSVRRLDFSTARRGVLVDAAGRLWTTADGGRRWSENLSTGTALIRDVAFGDSRRGFLAIDRFGTDSNGYVLRTGDGGASFTPQLVSRQRIGAGQLVAGGGLNAVALDTRGRLFGTGTGGAVARTSRLTLTTARRAITRRQLRAARGRVTVAGTLAGSSGGETVTVSARTVTGGAWRQAAARVSGAGRFTATFALSRSTAFVAQWRGDDARNGDGTPALIVRVR